MLELACATIFIGGMAFAGSMDLLTMTIPNRISIFLVGSFFVVAPLAGLGLQDIAIHVATCLAVLAVGIFMFARGWMGGGDAKIFAAATLWFGFDQLGEFAFATALLGGVLTIVLLIVRRFPLPRALLKVNWLYRLHHPETGVPYGIAIAAAALMVYPSIAWI